MFAAYCYSEGDVHFGDHTNIPEGAIVLMTGRESDIRRIIDKECHIGKFSGRGGAILPMITAVSIIAASSFPDQAAQADELGKWLHIVADKYNDRPVIFTKMKEQEE